MVQVERALRAQRFGFGESFPRMPEEKEALFAWFRESMQYEDIAQEARRALPLQSRPAFVNFMEKFTSGIHHALSHVVLAAHIGREYDSRMLLGPDQTLTLFANLYPRSTRVARPFKPKGLSQINVPDGVLIEQNGQERRIAALCEYTLQGAHKHVRSKDRNLQRLRKHFPQLFTATTLLFVLPQEASLLAAEVAYEVSFYTTSYTHEELRIYVHSLYEELQVEEAEAVQGEEGDGSEELLPEELRARVRARMEEQVQRVLFRQKDKLTPEWRKWAEKYASLVDRGRGT